MKNFEIYNILYGIMYVFNELADTHFLHKYYEPYKCSMMPFIC